MRWGSSTIYRLPLLPYRSYMYQFPCPTDGQCRANIMEKAGIVGWKAEVPYGTKRMFGVKFNCCTQCHLPVNKREADWLNKELGYTPNDIEIDSDFMDMLNGI